MKDLIAKLEAATEGSRELDNLIWFLPNGPDTEADYNGGHAPHYTTSIDAALTLVPGGVDWSIGTGKNTSPPEIWYSAKVGSDMDYVTNVVFTNSTPALAICIAALKAKDNE